MNKNKLFNFLAETLKELIIIKDTFYKCDHEACKQLKAKMFQEQVLTILDYIHNNFPTTPPLKGTYFPRPKLEQSEKEYKKEISNFKNENKKIKKRSKKIKKFLICFFKLNLKYGQAISYVDSKSKHERPNTFDKQNHTKIDYNITTNLPFNPLHISEDENHVKLPGFDIHGSNVAIKNVVISDGAGVVHINNLDINIVSIVGNKITFKNGNEFEFGEWAKNCINICSESIKKFKEQFNN